ncbi:hypothetical protein Q7P35_002187 [Cladosporium inversicolor]
MDYLFIKLRKRSNEVLARPELFTDYYTHCLNHGFDKLSEYYTKIDNSPYYAASVGSTKGGAKAITTAKRAVRTLFGEYLKQERASELVTPPSPLPRSSTTTTATTNDDDERRRQVNELVQARKKQQEAELDRFMNDSLDIYFKYRVSGEIITGNYLQEPLRWWRERGEALYPTLATMAYDLFAMPGMSSDLKPDIIEADLCLKNWFKHGIADGKAAFANIAGDDELALG